MDGPHDVGGAHGFGQIDVELDEPVFHHDWERRVFGAFFSTWGTITNLDQVRYARERIDPVVYLASSYYERWVLSLETILLESGLVSEAELAEALSRPDDEELPSRADTGQLANALTLVHKGGSGARPLARPPRFGDGEQVRVVISHTEGHTRAPRYVRGRRGVVVAARGGFLLPDAGARGEELVDHLYTVRFRGSELWGPDAEASTSVAIDLWESYLEPAA
jgi:nitrile hydratase subunit beta